MSSIGLIFRSDSSAVNLSKEFVPQPLGTVEGVTAAIEKCAGESMNGLYLELTGRSLRLEIEDQNPPRVVSAIGVWGDAEMGVIRCICGSLGARFYDSEMSEFFD